MIGGVVLVFLRTVGMDTMKMMYTGMTTRWPSTRQPEVVIRSEDVEMAAEYTKVDNLTPSIFGVNVMGNTTGGYQCQYCGQWVQGFHDCTSEPEPLVGFISPMALSPIIDHTILERIADALERIADALEEDDE